MNRTTLTISPRPLYLSRIFSYFLFFFSVVLQGIIVAGLGFATGTTPEEQSNLFGFDEFVTASVISCISYTLLSLAALFFYVSSPSRRRSRTIDALIYDDSPGLFE